MIHYIKWRYALNIMSPFKFTSQSTAPGMQTQLHLYFNKESLKSPQVLVKLMSEIKICQQRYHEYHIKK